MKKFRTVVVDGETKRVPYKGKPLPADQRNAGLLPSRVHKQATTYARQPKHRYAEEDE